MCRAAGLPSALLILLTVAASARADSVHLRADSEATPAPEVGALIFTRLPGVNLRESWEEQELRVVLEKTLEVTMEFFQASLGEFTPFGPRPAAPGGDASAGPGADERGGRGAQPGGGRIGSDVELSAEALESEFGTPVRLEPGSARMSAGRLREVADTAVQARDLREGGAEPGPDRLEDEFGTPIPVEIETGPRQLTPEELESIPETAFEVAGRLIRIADKTFFLALNLRSLFKGDAGIDWEELLDKTRPFSTSRANALRMARGKGFRSQKRKYNPNAVVIRRVVRSVFKISIGVGIGIFLYMFIRRL